MRLAALRVREAARRELKAARAEVAAYQLAGPAAAAAMPIYLDPVDYAREVLHVVPTAKQIEIAQAIRKPPYRVLVPSGHTVGKTFLAAWLTNHYFDTYRDSCAIITVAPNAKSLETVLWAEIRRQRSAANLGAFPGPRVCELRDGPNRYALGIATDRPEKITGHHLRHMLFVFDEGVAVKPFAWDAIRSMFQADGDHAWLVIGNPTDSTSRMYAEEMSLDINDQPLWNTISLSSLDHPNIDHELRARGEALRGRPYPKKPYPGAISLSTVEDFFAVGSDPIGERDAVATDIQWPPEWWRREYTQAAPAKWYRPGPELEARALGRWPSQSSGSVWSDSAWRAALSPLGDGLRGYWQDTDGRWRFPGEIVGQGTCRWLPEIGCDPARFGRNNTAIMVRVGPHALHFETHNGWDSVRTVGALKELAREWADWATARIQPNAAVITPQQIKVKVDSDGLGGAGIIDWADPGWTQEFRFIGISAASPPIDPSRYLNKRSELWFHGVDLAKMGRMDLSRLPKKVLAVLRQQAMAPQWKMDGLGHRVVERKEEMEKRGVPSPDALDALNICYDDAEASQMTAEVIHARGQRRDQIGAARDSDPDGFDEPAAVGRPVMYRGR